MSAVSWKSPPREPPARGGGSVRGRAPVMSSTVSEAGTRVGRAARVSAITAPASRVRDMDAKRSAGVVVGTAASG